MPGEHGYRCNCGEEVSTPNSQTLLPFIRLDGVRGMNAQIADSAVNVFKTFDKRLDESQSCISCYGEDPVLLIHVPFISPCKVTGMKLIGGDFGRSPKSVKLFINNETLDFESIEDSTPTQTVDLVEDFCGMIEYPLKAAKFTNVNHLTLYFSECFNGNIMEIFYIDIRGVGSNYKRNAVVTVYESRANIADHSVSDEHKPTLGLS